MPTIIPSRKGAGTREPPTAPSVPTGASRTRAIAYYGALAALVLRERSARTPLMPLRLFAELGRSSAYLGRFRMMGSGMAYFFLMPTAMQNVFGFTPLAAAVGFLPLTITQFVISLGVSRLPRLSRRPS
ncbi:MAG: hypothetical protein LKE76_07090 [Atopobiaceae bacterium]|nr:hypothetical protein [Atopobiaceae bacterium]MCI1389628.1 hypothetical protein [Atopobiaceae bacterium]